jgi:glyoxylate/succinic semialdehyde reductase
MALADKAGLAQSDLLEVLSLGAMANPMFALKGPAMQVRHKQKFMFADPAGHTSLPSLIESGSAVTVTTHRAGKSDNVSELRSLQAHQYPPAFPLKHQQKDMRLALALG